jgi:hypothetical protein
MQTPLDTNGMNDSIKCHPVLIAGLLSILVFQGYILDSLGQAVMMKK